MFLASSIILVSSTRTSSEVQQLELLLRLAYHMLKTGKIETSIYLIMTSWVHIKQIGRERDRDRWCPQQK